MINPKIYLSGAMALGCFQVIEAALALYGYTSKLSQAFSLLEVAWLPVSIVFFFAFKKQRISLFLPSAYLIYTLYGLCVGIYLSSIKIPDESFVYPNWYLLSALVFGFFYTISSLLFYKRFNAR